MHRRHFRKRLPASRLRGRGMEADYVLVSETLPKESQPKPIASQSNNEKKLVKIIEDKMEANSIINTKKTKPKKIEYISTEALLR